MESIAIIEVERDGEVIIVERGDAGWTVAESGSVPDSASVANMLDEVDELRAIGFVEDGSEFPTEDVRRFVARNESGDTVLALEMVQVDAEYWVRAAGNDTLYRLAAFRATRIVPEPVERSTYVLVSSGFLLLLFWQWRPVPEPVWRVEHGTGVLFLSVLFWMGWGLVVLSAAMIGHLDLFGLRQAYLRFKRREYPPDRFRTPGFYRLVRHPLMLGLIVAFWATPVMSAGHLMFAAAATGYILLALPLEERDLMRRHGDDYRRYRERVPMLVPTRILKDQE